MAVLALTSSGMGAVLPVSLRLILFRLAQHLLQTLLRFLSRKSSFRREEVMLTLPWDQYRLLIWAMQQRILPSLRAILRECRSLLLVGMLTEHQDMIRFLLL